MKKFNLRVWDIENKVMRYDGFGVCPQGSFWQYADQGYLVNGPNKDEFVLMLSTGIEDSQGQLIHEGDVVNLHPEHASVTWHHRVIWKDGGFWLEGIHNDANMPLTFMMLGEQDHTWRVIGNEFETPELYGKV